MLSGLQADNEREEKMLFDKTTQILSASVYYSGLRHKVIANNIANADTPGYKALDISFKEQLEYLMRTRRAGEKISLPPPVVVSDRYSSIDGIRKDLNTVDIDREMADLSRNAILHNTYLEFLNNRFRILKTAISGNV